MDIQALGILSSITMQENVNVVRNTGNDFREVFEKIVGVPYTEIRRLPKEQPIFNITTLPEGADIRTLSLQLSEALRQRGRLLYLPEYPEEFKPL